MAAKSNKRAYKDVDEHNFEELDAWARNLKLEDSRPLSERDKRRHERASRVGRPSKAAGDKAGRYMVSMDPKLHKAAIKYSRQKKQSLSGLIAEALAERIRFKKSA